jgi:hypothetical protein
MGRKRIHPIKPSLSDRLAFDDSSWDKPDLQDYIFSGLTHAKSLKSSKVSNNLSQQKWRKGIIYKISCLANGREYVGQTIVACSIPDHEPKQLRRIIQHFQGLKKGIHDKSSMQRDWIKYGEEKFKFSIIEVYDERMFNSYYSFKNFLTQREIELIFELNSMYNSQIQSAILDKMASCSGMKYKTDFIEAISLGEVASIKIFQERLILQEHFKDFYPSMKYLFPGVKIK